MSRGVSGTRSGRLRQMHASQELRKARVGTQRIKQRIGFQKDRPVFLINSPMKPVKGLILVAKSDVNFRNSNCRKAIRPVFAQECSEDLISPLAIAHDGMAVRYMSTGMHSIIR